MHKLTKNSHHPGFQRNLILALDESPVYALEDSLLDDLLLTLECLHKEDHVALDEVDLPFLFLAQGEELQHLNEALTCLLHNH